MFFLKKLTFHKNEQILTPKSSADPPSIEPEISSEALDSLDSTPDQDLSYETSTLFSKFHGKQKLYSGPETFFEDEVWAPEYEPVRLFHKQWDTAEAEEQISSPSDPQ